MKCDCKNGHFDQVKRFPVGAKVVALCDIPEGEGRDAIAQLNVGVVTNHCADGRASFRFRIGGAHTFHFPEQYVAKLL